MVNGKHRGEKTPMQTQYSKNGLKWAIAKEMDINEDDKRQKSFEIPSSEQNPVYKGIKKKIVAVLMVSFRFRSFWRLFFVLWPPFGLCLLLCFVRFCFYTGEFGYISLGCREFIETRRPVRFSTCASARILLFGSQKNEDFSLFSFWFMSGDGWLRKFEFYWFKWKLINGYVDETGKGQTKR